MAAHRIQIKDTKPYRLGPFLTSLFSVSFVCYPKRKEGILITTSNKRYKKASRDTKIKDFCVSCWFLYAQLVSLLSIGRATTCFLFFSFSNAFEGTQKSKIFVSLEVCEYPMRSKASHTSREALLVISSSHRKDTNLSKTKA